MTLFNLRIDIYVRCWRLRNINRTYRSIWDTSRMNIIKLSIDEQTDRWQSRKRQTTNFDSNRSSTIATIFLIWSSSIDENVVRRKQMYRNIIHDMFHIQVDHFYTHVGIEFQLEFNRTFVIICSKQIIEKNHEVNLSVRQHTVNHCVCVDRLVLHVFWLNLLSI
jgi:hypothetical protein